MKNNAMIKTAIVFLLAVLITGQSVDAAPSARETVLGKSYGEWSAQWWQWLVAIPAGSNPILQSGPVNCALGQRGPVIFLPGTLGGGPILRSCTVPEKALFFPLVNLVAINTPLPDPQLTVAEKRTFADSTISLACNLQATLNGVPLVHSLTIARAQSPTFSLLAGPDDLLGRDPGELDPESVSDGYWIMVPPLSPGAHTLQFSGALCSPPGTPFFEVDVTYSLTVE